MIRFARRQYLTRSGAALGGVLAAACSLTESLWPGTGSPPRRAPPATLRVLYGPWAGAMYDAGPVVYMGPDGRPYTPDREWFHTTVAPAFMERYPDSTVSFESHHDPLHRALELHRAGTAPDIFQTDDLRKRRLDPAAAGRTASTGGSSTSNCPTLMILSSRLCSPDRPRACSGGCPFSPASTRSTSIGTSCRPRGSVSRPRPGVSCSTRPIGPRWWVTASWFGRVCLCRIARWFWWLLQLTGVTLYDGGQVAALENEAEVVLDPGSGTSTPPCSRPAWRRSNVADSTTQKPFSFFVDHLHWLDKGKVAHAWLPGSCRRRVRSSRLRYELETLLAATA